MDASDNEYTSVPKTFSTIRYCAEGVKNDFQKVVDRFLANESVRYEDFLQIWREMHFYHIFRGRQTKGKLKEFAEECLTLACELWIDSADFQVQVCGLYLLYGLYFCQPMKPKSRIRMTLPMWQAVQEFVTSVKQFQHCDVEYIYMKLLLSKAFHFVATVSKENAVEDCDYRRKKLMTNEEKGTKVTPTMIEDILEPDNILKFEVIDQQYQQMKRNLSGGQGLPDASLSVIQTDLLDAITEDVKMYKNRRLGVVNAPVLETAPKRSIKAELKEHATHMKASKRPRRRNVPSRLADKHEMDDIDEAAMNAAALMASRRPGFCGLETLNKVYLPTVAVLSDAEPLVIDEDETSTKTGKTTKRTPGKKTVKAKRNGTTNTPARKGSATKTTGTPTLKGSATKTTGTPTRKGGATKTSGTPTRKGSATKTTDTPSREGGATKTTDTPIRKGSATKTTDTPTLKGSATKTTDTPISKGSPTKTTVTPTRKGSATKTTVTPIRNGGATKTTDTPIRKGSATKTTVTPTLKGSPTKTTVTPIRKGGATKTTDTQTLKGSLTKTTDTPIRKGGATKTTGTPTRKDSATKTTDTPTLKGSPTDTPIRKGSPTKTIGTPIGSPTKTMGTPIPKSKTTETKETETECGRGRKPSKSTSKQKTEPRRKSKSVEEKPDEKSETPDPSRSSSRTPKSASETDATFQKSGEEEKIPGNKPTSGKRKSHVGTDSLREPVEGSPPKRDRKSTKQ